MKIIRPTAVRDSGGYFTRDTTATYYDSAGVLRTAAINEPRIGYDPVTHAHTGFILEAAATNLLTYSEQFDNAAWPRTRSSVTTGGTSEFTAPDGNTTADKLIEDATASNTHYTRLTLTTTAGSNTFSVFVKAGERNNVELRATTDAIGAIFNLTTKTVTPVGSGVGSIVDVGSGWYRCSVTMTLTAVSNGIQIGLHNGTSITYDGNGTSGLYIWGAQLEVGTAATSYIPTTTIATLRGADTVVGTSGLIYSSINEGLTPPLLLKPEILATQTIALTVQPYTFSFYGIGKVVFSGVHSGALQGTGANDRVYVTFTPGGAGNLVLTITSTVTDAQIDTGSVLKPYVNEPAWVQGATYSLGQVVSRTTPTTHKLYTNVSAGASSIAPESAPTVWSEKSPTNRWGAFDAQVSSSSKAYETMTYLLKPGRINSLAILGVSAASVGISLVLPTTGEIVYNSSLDLNGGNAVGNWYEYFYEPIYQTETVAITNLLDATLLDVYPYSEAVLAITLSYPSNIVSLGVLVVGISAELGSTQTAPTVGIIDYSKKEVDEFGNVSIIVRTFSKRVSAKVLFASNKTDSINQILAQYRSYPLVWVGAQGLYTSLIVYGFYKDYDITIENIIMSSCSLTIEGLT